LPPCLPPRKKCGFAVSSSSHEGKSVLHQTVGAAAHQGAMRTPRHAMPGCGPRLERAYLQSTSCSKVAGQAARLRMDEGRFVDVRRFSCTGSGAAGTARRLLGMGSSAGGLRRIGSASAQGVARTAAQPTNARSVHRTALPNTSLNRSTNGRSPGPGRWYVVHFHQPGPGALPSAPG
jgi:hypothetical protein